MFSSWRHFSEIGGNPPAKPIVPIILNNPHTGKEIRTWGLIDTGSDIILIDAEMGEIIGHDIEKGKKNIVSGIVADAETYEHSSVIKILEIDENPNAEKISFVLPKLSISYIKNFDDVPVILGCRDFLDLFSIFLDYPNKRFSFIK